NSSLSVSRVSTGNATGSLNIAAVSTAQFAIVQYLTVPEILEILSNPLSSNIVISSNQSSLKGTISLWCTTDAQLPNVNTDYKSLILTMNSTGKPITFNGTWIEIPRSGYGDAIFTTNSAGNIDILQSFGFSGWSFD